jgi:outer membrane protein assembly factor BamB
VTSGQTVTEFELKSRQSIGSAGTCDIVIPGAKFIHCVLSLIENDLSIQCLNSVTWNNEDLDGSKKLTRGDRIVIANTSIEWLSKDRDDKKSAEKKGITDDSGLFARPETSPAEDHQSLQRDSDLFAQLQGPVIPAATHCQQDSKLLAGPEVSDEQLSKKAADSDLFASVDQESDCSQRPEQDRQDQIEQEEQAPSAQSADDQSEDSAQSAPVATTAAPATASARVETASARGRETDCSNEAAQAPLIIEAAELAPDGTESAVGVPIGTTVEEAVSEQLDSEKSGFGTAVTAELPVIRQGSAAPESAAPNEEIFDLVSSPELGAERNIYSWLLLVGIILGSLGVANFAWKQKVRHSERSVRDKLRAELDQGGVQSVLRKVKELLADGELLYKKDFEEMRDRAVILAAANELNLEPISMSAQASGYVMNHGEGRWRKKDLSHQVKEVYLKRFKELKALLTRAKNKERANDLGDAIRRLGQSLRKNPLWLHIDHEAQLKFELQKAQESFASALDQVGQAQAVERLEIRVAALLKKRDPVAARKATILFLKENPDFSEKEAIASLKAKTDSLEKDILRLRKASIVAVDQTVKLKSWLRPLTQRSLKTLPKVLDSESPVFFSGGSTLVALDPETGKTRWILPSDAEEAPEIVSLETRDAYIAWTRQGVIQVLLPDGRVVAQCELGVSLIFPPVFFNSYLYAPCSDGLLRVVDLETGRLIGQHSLTGRLIKELGKDAATERVIAALAHNTLAIVSPKEDFIPELIRGDFECLRFGVPPLLIRDYAVIFENLPGQQARMLVFVRVKGQYNQREIFQFEGWVVRSPVLLNGRLVVTTDSGCVYPFTVNTVDSKEGVSAAYDVKQAPRKIEGETLLVAQMTLPNFLYFGGRRIERKLLNEKTGWWSRERFIYQDSVLPDIGVVHKPFQITEDRLFVTSMEKRGDGLTLTAMDLGGKRFWQLRAGLPLSNPFFGKERLYYQEQGGAVFQVTGFDKNGMRGLRPSLANTSEGPTASLSTLTLPFRHGKRQYFARPGSGRSLEVFRVIGQGYKRTLPVTSEQVTNCITDLEKMWSRDLRAVLISQIIYHRGRLIFATSDGLVRAYDAVDGKEFVRPFPGRVKFPLGPLLLEGSRIVVGGQDGSVRVLELSPGPNSMLREMTRSSFGTASLTALEKSKSCLWLGNSIGRVVRLTLHKNYFQGALQWQLTEPIEAITCTRERALVTTSKALYCLTAGSRELKVLHRFQQQKAVGKPYLSATTGAIVLSDGQVVWIDLQSQKKSYSSFGRPLKAAHWHRGFVFGVTSQGLIGRLSGP